MLRLRLHHLLVSATVLAFLVVLAVSATRAEEDADAQEGWNFKKKGFVIGAWWGPGANDAEMKLYADAGFDLVMTGRYMQLESYGDTASVRRQMDLAAKHGLGVLLDTYTKDDRPWGGKGDIPVTRGHHHPASLPELAWLHERVGAHPALVGYLLGDDQGSVDGRLADTTSFLKKNAPHLFPWICGWIPGAELAAHGNPILDHQIYPTLYEWNTTAEHQRDVYLKTYAVQRLERRRHHLLVWPMLNTCLQSDEKPESDMFAPCPSDSLVRLPIYATVAYGFDGLMYFCYNGGALCHVGTHDTEATARAALTPLYPVVKEANARLRSWAPRLVGLRSEGLIANLGEDPVNGHDVPELSDARSFARPAPGKLVRRLDDDLLVGLLTKEGQPPLAMVVDLRVGKGWGDRPARQASIQFDPAVEGIRVLDTVPRDVEGPHVTLTLRGGEGMLLELRGDASRVAEIGRLPTLYRDVPPRIEAERTIFVAELVVAIHPAEEGATIHYTTDGTDPLRTSPRYEEPLVLSDSTTITACAEVGAGLSAPATVTFRRVEAREAAQPMATESGLTWALYKAVAPGWDRLPDFSRLPVVRRRTAPAPDVGVAGSDDLFGLVFEGYLAVPTDGVYSFRLASDDGARLEIDDVVVADHDGLHGMAAGPAAGEAALKAGLHPIRISYFEKAGDQGLVLEWSGPGIPWQEIPASAYCHAP